MKSLKESSSLMELTLGDLVMPEGGRGGEGMGGREGGRGEEGRGEGMEGGRELYIKAISPIYSLSYRLFLEVAGSVPYR